MNPSSFDKREAYYYFDYEARGMSPVDGIFVFNIFWSGSDAVYLFDKELELLAIFDKKREN